MSGICFWIAVRSRRLQNSDPEVTLVNIFETSEASNVKKTDERK